MRKLSTDEMETTFTIEATNRDVVRVYSGDPYFQRRLERVGAKLVDDCIDGGRFYELPLNQLRITKPPRALSNSEKRRLAIQLQAARDAITK